MRFEYKIPEFEGEAADFFGEFFGILPSQRSSFFSVFPYFEKGELVKPLNSKKTKVFESSEKSCSAKKGILSKLYEGGILKHRKELRENLKENKQEKQFSFEGLEEFESQMILHFSLMSAHSLGAVLSLLIKKDSVCFEIENLDQRPLPLPNKMCTHSERAKSVSGSVALQIVGKKDHPGISSLKVEGCDELYLAGDASLSTLLKPYLIKYKGVSLLEESKENPSFRRLLEGYFTPDSIDAAYSYVHDNSSYKVSAVSKQIIVPYKGGFIAATPVSNHSFSKKISELYYKKHEALEDGGVVKFPRSAVRFTSISGRPQNVSSILSSMGGVFPVFRSRFPESSLPSDGASVFYLLNKKGKVFIPGLSKEEERLQKLREVAPKPSSDKMMRNLARYIEAHLVASFSLCAKHEAENEVKMSDRTYVLIEPFMGLAQKQQREGLPDRKEVLDSVLLNSGIRDLKLKTSVQERILYGE